MNPINLLRVGFDFEFNLTLQGRFATNRVKQVELQQSHIPSSS